MQRGGKKFVSHIFSVQVSYMFSIQLIKSKWQSFCNFLCKHCWGKLLLKLMHWNIALLPKKVTNYVSYFLWKVMCYVTRYFLNMSMAWLFVFNIRSSIYSKCKSPFTTKSIMNKPQAEGEVNSRLYSRTQEKKVQHSSNKKQWSTSVSLFKVIFAY